jgi:flagellar hook assembly protein FlgD
MRLDGDGDPVLMNRWIPFQRSMRLSLTPGTGSRTVGVTFRNRFGRESSRAQDTVTLGVEGVATRPLTTVIRRGGAPIRIECQLTSSGHIKVWVMDRRGETIATLFDEERGAGLWPVDWDGRNGAGEPVAPGIYVLHIETPGGSEKKSIVVQ